jgi:glycosyltransferase involved in cell wall biosynthesis
MATYNGGNYLSDQLKSIAAQTRLPGELIVCDDVSTDNTMEILSDFAQTVPFEVRLFRNERNVGYALNFERAIASCRGEIILLSDQDDYWNVDKVHVIECAMEQHTSAWMLIDDAKIGDENLETTGLTVVGQDKAAGISSDEHLLGCCIAFRSSMKPLIIPVPWRNFGHDGWTNSLARALGRRLYIQDTLQIYRRH